MSKMGGHVGRHRVTDVSKKPIFSTLALICIKDGDQVLSKRYQLHIPEDSYVQWNSPFLTVSILF